MSDDETGECWHCKQQKPLDYELEIKVESKSGGVQAQTVSVCGECLPAIVQEFRSISGSTKP